MWVDLEKNAWKGLAWQLFFMWPFAMYFLFEEVATHEELGWNTLLIISGLISGSGLWFYGLFRLIKLLKNPFGSKRKKN